MVLSFISDKALVLVSLGRQAASLLTFSCLVTAPSSQISAAGSDPAMAGYSHTALVAPKNSENCDGTMRNVFYVKNWMKGLGI